jgi:hypothetical protein
MPYHGAARAKIADSHPGSQGDDGFIPNAPTISGIDNLGCDLGVLVTLAASKITAPPAGSWHRTVSSS